MNYRKHYDKLMDRARARQRPATYVESHHVKPRHAGGSDDPENLVWLTAREHFVAHMLLAMGGSRKDWIAVTFFAMDRGRPRYVNGRLYAIAAERSARIRSEALRGIPKGSMPLETRQKIAQAKRGVDTLTRDQRDALNEKNRNRVQPDEERARRANALRGVPQDPGVVARRSEAMRGMKRTPEQCERIRQALLRRGPVSQETRDKQSVARRGMKRSIESREKMRTKALEREAAKRFAKTGASDSITAEQLRESTP